jgi:hypothetical protein
VSEKLETLSRDLASGMSRRRAFWQFVTGLGVVGALTGRKAKASQNIACYDFCGAQAQILMNLCLGASQSCKSGTCAEISLVRSSAPTVNFNGSGGGPFVCVPPIF